MTTLSQTATMTTMTYLPANHLSIDEHFGHLRLSVDSLPEYENEDAPPSYLTPLPPDQSTTYKLKQFDRSSQKLVPLSSLSNTASLIVTTKTRTKLFSSPPDILFTVEKPNGESIAPTEPATVTIRYDNDASTLPYCPKAHLKVMGGNGIMIHNQSLFSDDFVNWKFRLNDVEHYWGVRLNPAALVLKNKATEQEVARFTYSEVGIDASRGGYVGELVVGGWGAEVAGGLRELLIVVSAFVVVIYWRKLGRNYRNRGVAASGREVILTSPH